MINLTKGGTIMNEEITSNYIHETLDRLNNIKNFMLLHQKDLDLLSIGQTKQWSNVFRLILEIQNNKNVLYYITDDLRKIENEGR